MTVRDYVRENKVELEKMRTHQLMAEAVVKELGCTERRAMEILSQELRRKLGTAAVVTTKPGAGIATGLTRADLLDKFDSATRARGLVREGVATLTDDDEIFLSSRFCSERCHGASALSFKQIAQEPEFQQYQFRVGDQIFWSTPATKAWALQSISRAREV
jgi:hypothetical protein